MTPSLNGLFDTVLIFMVLAVALVVTHVVWLRQVVAQLRRRPIAPVARLALFLLALMSPLVGPYAVMAARGRAGGATVADEGRRRIIMPGAGLASVMIQAHRAADRYAGGPEVYRQAFLEVLPAFLCFWLFAHAVLYLMFSTFGRTRRGPLSSNVHLLSAIFVLAVA